jgi:large subunit ribosomal protein L24|tara:strand:+ start:2637 stop:2891 length:255 start_codon:yes stop_codon:yes gene_type:complete
MIKKGNKVKVLTGKDKSKEGEVIEIDRQNNRVKVKGINIVKKHVKTTKEKKGGIISKENFINISNLSLFEKNKSKSKNKIKEIK